MNLRQLRDTRQLKEWLRAGETVELRERDTVLGQITPVEVKRVIPDFRSRAREIFGDRRLPGANVLIEERENSRY